MTISLFGAKETALSSPMETLLRRGIGTLQDLALVEVPGDLFDGYPHLMKQ